jgi:hypothetical protein
LRPDLRALPHGADAKTVWAVALRVQSIIGSEDVRLIERYVGGIFVERTQQISIGLMPVVRSVQTGLLRMALGIGWPRTVNPQSQPVPDIPQTSERDMSKILTSALVALLVTAAVPALAQGSGGGSGSGSGAASGSAGSAGTGTGTSTAPSAQNTGAGVTTGAPSVTGTNQNNNNSNSNGAAGTSPSQANRNSGVGTAPNGLPIGSPGSGVGSPEQPIDSRVR